MKVYLAGPIKGTTFDGATGWRNYATEVLLHEGHGVEVLNPMRGKNTATIAMEGDRIHHTSGDELMKGDVARDRRDVQRSDVILAYLLGAERVSIGTVVEYGWADAGRKIIVTVIEPGNLHEHPFIVDLSSYLVATLDEALNYILNIGKTERR